MTSQIRRTGRPPRLSRERILEVAQQLDPATLTMKAVAEALGVDRKSLHYYVVDRQGLLNLLAEQAFVESLSRMRFSPEQDWRTSLRGFAVAVREASVRTGATLAHYRFSPEGDTAVLRVMEDLVLSLAKAGFSILDIRHTLASLTQLATASGRDEVANRRTGIDIQTAETASAINALPSGEVPVLHTFVEVGLTAKNADTFDFVIDVLVSGLETRLAGTTAQA